MSFSPESPQSQQTPEQEVPLAVVEEETNLESKEYHDPHLRVSILGGTIDTITPEQQGAYHELGKILAREGVFLLSGPVGDNSYSKEVITEFLKENELSKQEDGKFPSRTLEIVNDNRESWVERGKEWDATLPRGEKRTVGIPGGVSQLTAHLERPSIGLYLFFPGSSSSTGTLAEAVQIISHLEAVIRTNKATEHGTSGVVAYPLVPKVNFVDWNERDQIIIQGILQRSTILTPPDEPERFNDIISFTNIQEMNSSLPEVIEIQKEKWHEYRKSINEKEDE